MKTILQWGFLIFLSTMIVLPACNHKDEEEENRDSCLEMAPGDICNVDDEFSIRFVKVFADSRCPLDLLCAWEGQGEIEVEYLIDDIVVKKDSLNVRPGMSEAGVSQYEQYHIEAIMLDPYPENIDPINHEDYRLSLDISTDWFQANITGVNPTLCPSLCCAGYHIQIAGKNYTNYNYFELSNEDPNTATFPIPIEIRFEHDILYPCHVVITELRD